MTTVCPACRSESIRWRARRVVTPGMVRSARELIWTCRGCGAEWVDPVQLVPPLDTPPDTFELPRVLRQDAGP